MHGPAAAELRLYFVAWCESRAELHRLAAEPSPDPKRVERAKADELYDRLNYRRLKKQLSIK
jgi:hypothetical protein